MSTITCCFGCTQRHPHCHSSCEEYASQKIEYEKFKAYMAKAKEQSDGKLQSLFKLRPIKTPYHK